MIDSIDLFCIAVSSAIAGLFFWILFSTPASPESEYVRLLVEATMEDTDDTFEDGAGI